MSKNNELEPLDTRAIQRAFDKAATTYDDYAVLQRTVADNLLETLTLFSLNPATIIDLGSGTGYSAKPLQKRFTKATLTQCDISLNMLQQARRKSPRWFSRRNYVCADINHLPFADNSADLLFSSLSFQWCRDLDRLFAESRRVLKADGLLIFSSLGPDTLRELRESFRSAGNAPHVHDFIDMHDVGDALIRAGFSAPVLETDRLVLTYSSMREVMKDLRGIGAVNQAQTRRRGLTTKALFKQAEEAYEAYRAEGLLPATYEVVYGHAFCPTEMDPKQDGSRIDGLNQVMIPVEKITRRGA